MKFKAKKTGLLNTQFIVAVLFPFVAAWLAYDVVQRSPWVLVITFLPLAVIIWVKAGTGYEIRDNILLYRSAFLRGKIDINTITKVDVQTTLWVGKKAATGPGGIVITYDNNKTIYITPESNDAMVKQLRKINRNIVVS